MRTYRAIVVALAAVLASAVPVAAQSRADVLPAPDPALFAAVGQAAQAAAERQEDWAAVARTEHVFGSPVAPFLDEVEREVREARASGVRHPLHEDRVCRRNRVALQNAGGSALTIGMQAVAAGPAALVAIPAAVFFVEQTASDVE